MLYDTPKRRRLLMPLVILLVGGAIALWGTQRETKRSEQVRQIVLALCRDIRAGHDVSARVQAMTGGLNPLLMKSLQDTCFAAGSADEITVEVTPGDVENGGTLSGNASHTAIVRVNGSPMLGLRIKLDSDGAPVSILGHFTPTSQ